MKQVNEQEFNEFIFRIVRESKKSPYPVIKNTEYYSDCFVIEWITPDNNNEVLASAIHSDITLESTYWIQEDTQ